MVTRESVQKMDDLMPEDLRHRRDIGGKGSASHLDARLELNWVRWTILRHLSLLSIFGHAGYLCIMSP